MKKIRQGKRIKREGEEWKTESQDCGVRETQTADLQTDCQVNEENLVMECVNRFPIL